MIISTKFVCSARSGQRWITLHQWTGRLIATCMVCCEKCIASLKREYDEHYHVIWPTSIGNLGSDFSRSYVGWQFRLVVCCILYCVLCAVCSTLTILSRSTQHSTQPPPIAHPIAHLYSIAYWDLIDFGSRTLPREAWYLWNSHLHRVSCLISVESIACWFSFDAFLMTCLTRWQNTQWKLNPTILKFTAFVKISFSGCWLLHPKLHGIVG